MNINYEKHYLYEYADFDGIYQLFTALTAINIIYQSYFYRGFW